MWSRPRPNIYGNEMSDRLDPQEFAKFRDALADAFNRATYEEFHNFHFPVPLKNIVGPNDTDPIVFRKVLEKANTECWWRELLSLVRQERPNNTAFSSIEISTLSPKRLDEKQIATFCGLLANAFIRPDFEIFVSDRLNKNPGDLIAPDDNNIQAITKVIVALNSESPPRWRIILSEARICRRKDVDLQDFEPELRSGSRVPPAQIVVPHYEAVILGSPNGSATADVMAAIEDLKKLLTQRGVSFIAFSDEWAKKGSHPELLEWAGADRRPILIQPIDSAWARPYALNPELLAKFIDDAAGAQTINWKYLIWLPQATEDEYFAERLKAQPAGGEPGIWFRQCGSEQLSQIVGKLLGRETPDGELPPAFGYQDVEYKKMPGGNIIRNVIIPEAAAPLQRYRPPAWEDVPFVDEADAVKIIRDMMLYQFGVVAIHNFNDAVDQEGVIPIGLRDRILTIDKIVQKFARDNGTDPKNILCLGIIATTKPEMHAFQYLRRASNEIIARWRFIAVAVEDSHSFHVDSGHLNSLCQELQARVSQAGQGRAL